MMDLTKRSYELELLDQEHIPTQDLYQNLAELNTINTLLGGHDVTLKGLKSLLKGVKGPITIADVGCGGGDNLRKMALLLRNHRIDAKLIGIDMKPDCIQYAKNQCKTYPEISFITSDYQFVTEKFDIITSALFCHHLTDDQLIQYLNWSKNNSRIGFFINDLHRHTLAYYSIKWLTYFFSKSYLVKNDAPLSVNRGFRKSEWHSYFSSIPMKHLSIRWIWAFRHLIIARHVQ